MFIQCLQEKKGLSIIELLIGTIFVVVGVLGIALVMSKSMRSGRSDQLHWLAVGIASSKIQSIKLLPLQTGGSTNTAYVQLTAMGTPANWFGARAVANTAPPGGCDCTTVNWSLMTPIPLHNAARPNPDLFPYSEVITMNGVPFTCKVCLNRLEGQPGSGTQMWPYCPAPLGATTAYQNQYVFVRVQVSWTPPQGTQQTSTEADTLIGMQL